MTEQYTPQYLHLLDTKDLLIVSRKLAMAIGLDCAILFRQIHYWVQHNAERNINLRDGEFWAYSSYKTWQERDFNFWSFRKIQRLFPELESLHLIKSTAQYNENNYDHTKWYTINYPMFDAFIYLWELHGCPVRGESRISDEYQEFIDNWESLFAKLASRCSQLGVLSSPTWLEVFVNLATSIYKEGKKEDT